MAAPLPPELAAYLANHKVMTLATQGADGPWAAAVFYAWVDGALIFLSSPKSRHGANLAQDGRCAATIQEDYDDWRQIKGVQLEGRVEQLQGEEASRARAAYAGKFPIISPLAKIPPAIVEALARIAWYRLVPERMYFIDNGKGFGHRDEFLPS
ncbi:MAG: pyridoxamine 5'-phosphate oxidase family protein [Rhodocyclales bacterium]|nr:pyridoxamine 5'-phosphate oxidase family protein [Rhodocyclales bacterium]